VEQIDIADTAHAIIAETLFARHKTVHDYINA